MELLIVDDDQVDRAHIKRTLRRGDTQCMVTEAEDVNVALELLKKHYYDAILVDYNMPQRNGIELLHEVKTNNVENASAIIMMSTSEEEELAMECLEAGAHDFIAKLDINGYRLRRAILGAQARFKMEKKLKESYEKVKQLAERDNLTQLANRYLFDESLKRSIAANNRGEYKVALLMFDLDHFKFVNDTYGHDIGDLLLQRVVNRIPTCLRGPELFSRLGGDEFAIVLNHIDKPEDAERVALRILKVLEKPFEIENASLNIGASIGVSIYPDDGKDATEIVKSADIAMYKAKHLGRNQVSFYKKEMQEQFLHRYKLESDLAVAIRDKLFELHFQPVYATDGKLLTGFEALIRWNNHGENVRPDLFIPVAEETKMIHPIGRWAIDIAVKQLAKWRVDTGIELNMAINLSPIQLLDKEIVQYILQILDKYKVPAENIEFELTETALLDSSDVNLKTIKALSEIGCRIALDDFGTGYSSLSHLHEFPINTVKIDRTLLPEENGDAYHQKLVQGLVAMIKILDLEIVAEGVEISSQLELCQSLNIERMQGYLLSKPKLAKEIEELPEFSMMITQQV